MSETINGIRIIKYFGWENMVIKTMSKIRYLESYFILQYGKLNGMIDMISRSTSPIIYMAVFGIYIGMGDTLDAALAFTVISLFTIMELPTRMIGMVLQSYQTAKVSIDRIESFLIRDNFKWD